MAGQKNAGPLTRRAAGTIPGYSLVKQDASGQVVVCTATAADESIGVTGERAVVADELVEIYPLNGPGTILMRAASAIAINLPVFQVAGGAIDNLAAAGGASFRRVGVAMEAAGAQGDIIEVMPEKAGSTVTAPA